MKKIRFTKHKEHGDKFNEPTSKDFVLLSHFLDDIGRYFPNQQDQTIEDLKSVLKGDKTFDEIQDPDVFWNYGGGLGLGYFEIEDTTAYFEPDKSDAPRIVMPLVEVIEVVEEWVAFLKNG